MSSTVVLVTDALQLVAQVVPVIQAAVANGQTTIDLPTWNQSVLVRNQALTQLDADIQSADPKPVA